MGGPSLLVYLAIAGVLVVWDVVVAGQVGRTRDGAPWFRTITSLAGLLVVPAVVVAIADGSLLTARITGSIAWLWPLTLALFAAQAIGALAARLTGPAVGLPIAVWNVALTIVATSRWLVEAGVDPPAWIAALGAAQAHALGRVIGDMALTAPFALLPPLIAPAFPPRWRWSGAVRAIVAAVAAAGLAAIAREYRAAGAAVRGYAHYAGDPLQERPRGDFAIGFRILPVVRDAPGPYALRMDLDLVDSIGARAVLVVVDPRARGPALDSLARALDPYRRDSVVMIVAIGERPRARGETADDREALRDRLAYVEQVARRLRPQYLLAEPPDGDGAGRSLATRQELLARTAVVAHAVNGRIRIGTSLRPAVPGDSVLYAWATQPDSPVDAAGFAIVAGFGGAAMIDVQLATAARWMRAEPGAVREHWVWVASTAPVTHGEASQAHALRGMLAWATSQRAVNGLIVAGAGDYAARTGLRSASGRLRPAVDMLGQLIDALGETRSAARPAAPPNR